MAGERLSKITIEASFAKDDNVRGQQTELIRVFPKGTTFDVNVSLDPTRTQYFEYRRGAYTSLRQYIVPDPDDVQRDYVKQAVDNLLVLLKYDFQSRGLPYVVSASRDMGNALLNNQPRIQFDIEATQYGNLYDLDFTNASSRTDGFSVVQNLTALQPITATPIVINATTYGAADGGVYLIVTGGNTAPFTYKWADNPTATSYERYQLKAGTYVCTVSDADGVTTTVTCVVKSDEQLVVVVQQTEDSITLLVSGGVAPYAVAWDDGSTDFVRTGLSPGRYRGTVTDSHGASQDVVVELALGSYYWSRNPIEILLDAGPDYRLDPTTKPNLSFVAEVWLEPEYLSGVFVQVGPQLEQPADLEGRTTFNVQVQLDAYLADYLPTPTGALLELAGPLFKRFYLKTAEKYGDPEPVTAPLASAQVQVVLRGGLNEEEALARNWFTYQRAARPFLTWDPDYPRVLPAQPAYLFYQHLDEAGPVRLVRRVRHLDGSATPGEVVAELAMRRYEVACLRVGPEALGLTGPEVVGYDVWVASATGALLTTTRHFELERAYYPQQRFVLYSNSLGGVNTLPMLGQAKHQLEVVSSEAQRPRFDATLGDTVTYDRLGNATLSLVSAKRKRGQVYADQDVLLSRRVTLQRDGAYWPGKLVAATFTVRDEAEGLASLAFDFQLPAQRQFGPRLPAVVAGQVLAPIAGGEGPQP